MIGSLKREQLATGEIRVSGIALSDRLRRGAFRAIVASLIKRRRPGTFIFLCPVWQMRPRCHQDVSKYFLFFFSGRKSGDGVGYALYPKQK
jgi:hypothetical protein